MRIARCYSSMQNFSKQTNHLFNIFQTIRPCGLGGNARSPHAAIYLIRIESRDGDAAAEAAAQGESTEEGAAADPATNEEGQPANRGEA
jgi:hypothetical protein